MIHSTIAEAGARHHSRAFSNPVFAALRLAGIATATCACSLCWQAVRSCTRDSRKRYSKAALWTSRWSRLCLRLLGIHVRISGILPPPGGLITPNHLSYLDALAMAAVAPCFFAVKADVESWPVIGRLLRATFHIGVHRRNRTERLMATIGEVEMRLRHGNAVCVFLEGTSSGGDDVLPFKSSLLEAACRSGRPVVPAAIRWRACSPVDVAEDVAYWKDHVFAAHCWRLLGLSGIEVEIAFGEPRNASGGQRRAIADALHADVSRLYQWMA